MKISGIKIKLYNFIFCYIRLINTRLKFFDSVKLSIVNGRPRFEKKIGYQSKLFKYKNLYINKRCFIIGNGPSIKDMDLSPLKDEITMGSNGIYKNFEKMGFKTDFCFFEDRQQTYLRRKDIKQLQGTVKMISLSNAYHIPSSKDTLFFNERFPCEKNDNPFHASFSRDFPSVAYLGGTITYIMIQWAYFLGCDPVYVLGVDHNYGELPKLFPPGKLKITENNIKSISKLHFDKKYYSVGDVIGVPDVAFQNTSYNLSNKIFELENRKIYNCGLKSKLESFPCVDFSSLFKE